MKKWKKKAFAAFLVVAMIATMLPMTVFADTIDLKLGDGETPGTYALPTAKTLIYSGEEQELVNPGKIKLYDDDTGVVMKYALGDSNQESGKPDSTAFTTDIPKATFAGDYYVWYRITSTNSKYNGKGRHFAVKVTIDSYNLKTGAGEGKYALPTAKTLTYNGIEQQLVNPGVISLFGEDTGVVMKYALGDSNQESGKPDSTAFTTDIPKATFAGDYYVWYRITSTNPNYNGKGRHFAVKVTISPAEFKEGEGTEPARYVAPVAKENLTFNGLDQELIEKGTLKLFGLDDCLEMQYALGDDDVTAPEDDAFTTDIPEAGLAGDYYVWYRVTYKEGYTGDENYKVVDPVCLKVSIAKKDLEASDFVYASPKDLVYTGKEIEPTVGFKKVYTEGKYKIKGDPVVFFKNAKGEAVKEAVDPGKYEVWAKLPQGESTNKFSDKPADVKVGEFEIKEAPKTGDANNMILWVVMALAAAALAGTSIVVFTKKKVNK